MHVHSRAALAALVSFALVGCAGLPATQPLSRDVAAVLQPVDVKIGISQPELYAEFERATGGAAAAAACGAVPGLGILLAAACGGAMGAVDATVNASRAKAADETVRPLKDEIVDLNFDQLMTDSMTKRLQSVPGMQLSALAVTRTVTPKANEESFRASTSSAVMFVNVNYSISTDFSTFNVSAQSTVYPRAAKARLAAGLPADLPTDSQDQVLAPKNSAYRSKFFYHAKLPVQATNSSEYVAAWKADGGRSLRIAIQEGIAQVSQLLAEDLQRVPDAKPTTRPKVDADKGIKAELMSESSGGQLLRYPDGSLHFRATLSTAAASAAVAAPTEAPSTASAVKTAVQ
jgi:hypothetical protein